MSWRRAQPGCPLTRRPGTGLRQKKDGASDPVVYGERAQINLIRAAAWPRAERSPGEQIGGGVRVLPDLTYHSA